MISVFKHLNKFANKSAVLDVIAIFFARVLPYLMAIFLFMFCYRAGAISHFFTAVLSGIVSRFIMNEAIHLIYDRKRPAHIIGTNILIPVPKNYSFPSGHTSFLAGMGWHFIFYQPAVSIIFLILSCVVGVSRVFCGVHWFRDVASGVLAGLAGALITYYLLNLI